MNRPLRDEALTLVRAIPFYHPATRFGGVVAQAREVDRELTRRGHAVCVVTTDNGQPAATQRDAWVEMDGYRVWYGRTRPWHRVVPYWSPMLRAPLEAALAGADVLQLNVGLTLLGALAAEVAGRHSVPFVYNAEGALCPTRLRIKGRRKRLFLHWIERPVLRAAAALQVMTDKDAADHLRQGADPARLHTLPNGVVVPAPPPGGARAAAGAALRSSLGIAEDEPVVLFLGRLHAIKGLDLLLEGFARAAPAAGRLLIAGGDDAATLRPGLERQARALGVAARVCFLGHVDGAGKEAAWAAADVFALTSRTEGLPNAVLEACARGLPCLLTPACNLPELAGAGAGSVAPARAEAIAAALEPMLADAGLRARMSAAARRLARERFALPEIVSRLEGLYRGVARR